MYFIWKLYMNFGCLTRIKTFKLNCFLFYVVGQQKSGLDGADSDHKRAAQDLGGTNGRWEPEDSEAVHAGAQHVLPWVTVPGPSVCSTGRGQRPQYVTAPWGQRWVVNGLNLTF